MTLPNKAVQFLCHQHLCCVAYRDRFIIQFCGIGVGVVGVCRRLTLYSGQYLKNGLSDLIQIWHLDVTGPGDVLYSVVTLNSTSKILKLNLSFFVSGQYLKNDLMDSVQIKHVVVTSFEGVPYLKVTLNSHI